VKKTVVLYGLMVVLLVGLVVRVARPPGEKRLTRTEFLMDTIVNSVAFSRDRSAGEKALGLVYLEMARLEVLLDRYRDSSDVSKINRSAGEAPVSVTGETLDVIIRALQVGTQTGGAFDITVAPVLSLWGFGTAEENVPAAEELAKALRLVDFRGVRLDEAAGTVFLETRGSQIDLGGIAKGYIVDRAAEFLLEQGITSAYLDAGGDIRVIGEKPDGSPWRIGVRHPRERREIIAIVELRDQAIVTSGDYERFFIADGTRYHHIIDPATGYPAQGLVSVTVVAPDALTADALSTAGFVLGLERAMALFESMADVEAIIVSEEGEVHITSGLQGQVEVRS
jgi:thiamine biosynthesis lipoprotein